jgi:putative aminopeptidase FrvX
MFTKEEYDLLETLINTPSPVGYEHRGQAVWMDAMRSVSDRVEQDDYGSAASFIDIPGATDLVMIEAHCDEIGMVVNHIADNGFVHVNKLGGSDSTIARARRVFIHARSGTVSGLTGHTAIHLQDVKNGGGKEPSWKEIYVDIGAASREEALQMVQIGDPVTYADQFDRLNDEMVIGRAIDNRIGGFILQGVMKRLHRQRESLKVSVMALNAVQEEVGGFGARMMSYRHTPRFAIVTDVTHATDIPGVDPREHGLVKLGGGPSIQHGGANHPDLVARLEKTAADLDLDVQHEATSVRTGTDTDSIFHQKSGIPSALVSVPLRYMHTPVEMAHLADVEACIRLIAGCVLDLGEDQSL